MNIYKSDGTLCIENLVVDDSSFRNRQIMGDHNLTLHFSLAEHVEIPIGAYCEYQGERYTLMRPENLKKKHSRYYEYTVIFDSPQAGAKIWKFRNPVDGRVKFPLTAKPHEHLEMFVENMNRRSSVVWVVGECIEGVEHCINYDHDYCWEALAKMAEEFNTEFEVNTGLDDNQRTIYIVSLHKVEYNKRNPLALSYGKGNGFKSGVGRTSESVPPVEYLFVQGGSDNIDASKYGSPTLLLPKEGTLSFDGEHFEDEEGFDEANARTYQADSNGLCIFRLNGNHVSHAEDSLECEDIYPKRVGKVTSVVVVDAEKHFYDIIDNTIPNGLNYNEYLIGGETMTIVFQSGELAGREFDVKYKHSDKRFEIVPQEIDGIMMPGGSFIPSTANGGDEYAIFGCMLPDAYINAYNPSDETPVKSGAEWDMFRAAVLYMYDNEYEKFTFTGTLDGIWAKKDWNNIGGKIKIGGFVNFRDNVFQPNGILVRIVGIKDYINKPHMPEIELSNKTASSGFSGEVKQLEAQAVAAEEYHKEAIAFTKRRFRDVREATEMLNSLLNSGFGNFAENISPITLQTMQAVIGDESLQFRFVMASVQGGETSYTEIQPSFNINNTNKTFGVSFSGVEHPFLQHLTLGIDSIRPSHGVSEYLTWEMSPFPNIYLDDGSKGYFLYAKVSKSTQAGVFEFRLEERAYGLDEVAGYYYLLVGILSSEYEGTRSFVPLYGFTEILPGRITTNKIVSSDGESFFDMQNNAMKLGNALSFLNGVLKLKGTIVQSQDGNTESPIGCYRGDYSSSTQYYNGDEVTYNVGVNTSTYRCISTPPSAGIAPTDTLYWAVVAQGAKGNDGTSLAVKGACYNHYEGEGYDNWEGESTTDEPVVLIDSFTEDNDTTYCIVMKYGRPRAGWAAGWRMYVAEVGDAYVMESDGHLWMADTDGWKDIGLFRGAEGQAGESSYLHIRFRSSLDSSSMSSNPSKYIGYCVTNSATAPTNISSYTWMQWKGEDGFGYEYIYQRSTTKLTNPSAPETSQTDGYVPTGWTADPSGVDDEYKFEYVCARKKEGGVWSSFSTPTLWANYSEEGRGITGVIEYYAVSANRYEAPTSWSTSIPQLTATNKYLWNKERINYSRGTAYEETTPVIIGTYGDDGRGITSITEMYLASNLSTGVTKNSLGWSTSAQSVSASKPYLYNYEIIQYTDGTSAETDISLIGHWGSDGADGEDGISPATVFRGDYDSSKLYYGNSARVDVVKYENVYYVARADAPSGTSGFNNVSPENTNYWRSFGATFESVATNLMLAELANIAGFIFRNGRLESQKLANGQTTEGATSATPMAYLNGNNGEASFAGGKVQFLPDGSAKIGNVIVSANGDVTMSNVNMSNVAANGGTFNGLLNATGGLRLPCSHSSNQYDYTPNSATSVHVNWHSGNGDTVVYLPSAPVAGQTIFIRFAGGVAKGAFQQSGAYRIDGNGKSIYAFQGTLCQRFYFTSQFGRVYLSNYDVYVYYPAAANVTNPSAQLVYDGTNWHVVSASCSTIAY